MVVGFPTCAPPPSRYSAGRFTPVEVQVPQTVAVVVGDGEKGGDQDHQAEFFLDSAGSIAKVAAITESVSIYVSDRASGMAAKLGLARTETFRSAKALVSKLKTSKPICLVVIGHGSPMVTDHGVAGLVELCQLGLPDDRQITTKDVNEIRPKIYIALHCHGGEFVSQLEPGITWFDLTGEAKGQNTDIVNFVGQKFDLTSFFGYLVTEDYGEAKTCLKTIGKNVTKKKAGAVGMK